MNKKLRTPIAATLLVIITLLSLFQLTNICSTLFHYKNLLNFYTILNLVVKLFLCCGLFAKKRNNLLLIAVGCFALPSLHNLIVAFSLLRLLDFSVYGLLFVFALAFCEQTHIKADLSKTKELAGKFFYIPAIIYLAQNVFSLFKASSDPYFSISFLHIISIALNFVVLLTLSMWLKDPYAKETPVSEGSASNACAEETGEAYCSLGKHIVLCLFTFGIWYLIWTYRTTKYLNNAPNATYYNPTNKLLLCMFIPFYQIYWFYKHGQRIDAYSKQKGLSNSDMATLCLILGIFIPLVACILMQDRINTLCTTKI